MENLKKSVDNIREFGVLLINLSKAFGCIDHKSPWYGLHL